MTLDEFKIKVKAWLKANGHDYPWLAKQLNGVSESTIRNWMARKDIPQAKRVEMAAVCNIDIVADPVGPLMKDGKEQPQKRHRRTKEEILADKAKEEAARQVKADSQPVKPKPSDSTPVQANTATQQAEQPQQKPEEKKPQPVASQKVVTKKGDTQSEAKAVSKYTLQMDVAAVYVHRMEVFASKQGKTGADLLDEFFKSFPQQ